MHLHAWPKFKSVVSAVWTARPMSVLDKEIKAVHVADLGKMLDRYGQREDFEGGKTRCLVCSEVASMSNVGSLRLVGGRLAFTCNAT